MSIVNDPNAFLSLLDAIASGEAQYPYTHAIEGAKALASVIGEQQGRSPYTSTLLVTSNHGVTNTEPIGFMDLMRVATGQVNIPTIQELFAPIHAFEGGIASLDKKGYRRAILVYGGYEMGYVVEAIALALGASEDSMVGLRVAAPNRNLPDHRWRWFGQPIFRPQDHFESYGGPGMVEYMRDMLDAAWEIDYPDTEEWEEEYVDREGQRRTRKRQYAFTRASRYPLWEISVYGGEVIF